MTGPEKRSFVIALAGPAGAGKSTLCRMAAGLLGDAPVLQFDDYDPYDFTELEDNRYPADWRAWKQRGFDLREVEFPPRFAADVAALCRGQAVDHPRTGQRMEPVDYLLLEEPYGRERADMAESIDLVVVVDLPLEVSISRALIRNTRALERDYQTPPMGTGPDAPARFGEALFHYVEGAITQYLEGGKREGYRELRRRLLENSDLVLDGMRNPEELAAEIASAARLARTAKEAVDVCADPL